MSPGAPALLPLMSVAESLSAAHYFTPGLARLPCPGAAALLPHVQRLLIEKGFLQTPQPLGELHRVLPPSDTVLDENYFNAVTRAFYVQDDALHAAYYQLLRELRRDHLRQDFVFQRAPIFRFHFPAPFVGKLRTRSGFGLQHHSDTLGGHPFELLQGWLPLTDCAGSAALHVAPLPESVAILQEVHALLGHDDAAFRAGLDPFYALRDREPGLQRALIAACQPQAMSLGEVLLFDPRCLHGGVENNSDRTRVSLDFRLMPLPVYERFIASPHSGQHPRFRRGDIFHRETIEQL